MLHRAALFVIAAILFWTPAALAKQQAHNQYRPRIDVAFLLDTTGSMTDLIAGAKLKIWSIANEMVNAEVPPEIRMALIGYRDRGDAYVTRRYDLTDDIDRVYGKLLEFQADGGGDRPESVNQALTEAVRDLNWNHDPRVLRVVFLVGDSPPQMQYWDDVKYPVTAGEALQRDIVINTILAGGAQDTGRIWKQIAALTHGEYAEISQSGNMQITKSPYDQQINRLNQQLDDTAIIYGNRELQEKARGKLHQYQSAPANVRADKSAFARSKGAEAEIITGRGELINDLANNRVELKDLEPEELPRELQGLSQEEQSAVITKKQEERRDLRRQIDELVEKRAAYIAEQQNELAAASDDSFDGKIREMIHKQGAAKGIAY